MANYLIDLMTWSYSRINTYLQCPYQFYLKYIECLDESPMFFSEYGSLVHEVLAAYYSGNTSSQNALNDYLIRFPERAVGACPSRSIKAGYFQDGITCLKSLRPIDGTVLDIESKVEFSIDDMPFVGFVDMVYEDADSCLCIMDHKSRTLKPRSKRKKPTQTDIELEFYLRQLYLYSIPIKEKYGKYPDFLEFNCYRSGNRIREPFHIEALEEARSWATSTIDQICQETKWKPNLEYWKCSFLCGQSHNCDYKSICEWR